MQIKIDPYKVTINEHQKKVIILLLILSSLIAFKIFIYFTIKWKEKKAKEIFENEYGRF